jgi:hypothetical protein
MFLITSFLLLLFHITILETILYYKLLILSQFYFYLNEALEKENKKQCYSSI